MTDLKCSVYNCAHQKGGCCCKPNIMVKGQGDTTECSSFAPKGVENSTGYSTPNDKLEISCSAVECIYNDEARCKADRVSINTMGGAASCSTFVKK